MAGTYFRLSGTLTAWRFAVFYSKLGERIIPPLFGVSQPNTPLKLPRAPDVLDRCGRDSFELEGLTAAA